MSRRRPKTNHVENLMARALDSRAVFDSISSQVAPILAQALREGWSTDRLYEHPKIKLLLAARQISIAVSEEDPAKALPAIRDLRDRSEGKPKERIETTHRLEKLPDEQLDSLLQSKLGRVSQEDDDGAEDAPVEH